MQQNSLVHYFKVIFAYAIELSSNYFSQITVINDISKQIEQRAYR